MSLIPNLQTGLVSLLFHIKFKGFFDRVSLSSGNPLKFYQWKLVSGFKDRKINIVLPSEVECIEPDPFIPTREYTSGYECDVREDANIHQKGTTNKEHASQDQERPQYSSPVRRPERIR